MSKFIPRTHQKKSIQLMSSMENAFLHKNSREKTNIGILGNDIGSGKTSTVLYHIYKNPKLQHCYINDIIEYTSMIKQLAAIVQEYLCANYAKLYTGYKIYGPCRLFYKHRYPSSDGTGDSDTEGSDSESKGKMNKNTTVTIQEYVSTDEQIRRDITFTRRRRDNPPVIEPYIEHVNLLPCSLIVCSHIIFKDVWVKEIEKFFSKTRVISWHRLWHANDKIDKNIFARKQLILCSTNKFKDLVKYCNKHHLRFQRVIFDEIASPQFKISSCPSIDSLFYWGITTTWNDLSNIKNTGFIRNLFQPLECEDIKKILVQVPVDAKALEFPPFVKYIVKCKTTPDCQINNKLYPKSKVAQLLRQEASEEAKKYLLDMCKSRNSWWRIQYHDVPNMSVLELQMQNIIDNRTLSLLTIQKRLYKLVSHIYEKEMCFRCYKKIGDEEFFTISCCGLLYCDRCMPSVFKCYECGGNSFKSSNQIKLWIDALLKERRVNIKKLLYIDEDRDILHIIDAKGDSSEDSSEEEELFVEKKSRKRKRMEEFDNVMLETKIADCITVNFKDFDASEMTREDATIKITQKHIISKEKILVFIDNINMVASYGEKFDKLNIKHLPLIGSSGRITNVIDKFKRNEVDILLLNGEQTGSGLNLQFVDVIIICDCENPREFIQRIGRAQRDGRKDKPLIVYVFEF